MNWAQFKDPVSHMYLAGTVPSIMVLLQKGWAGWQVQAFLL